MKILIDLQGIQNGSRYRGIGRYSLAFTKSLIRNRKNHEIILLFSDLFPESISNIYASFGREDLGKVKIMVWNGIAPTSFLTKENDWRRKVSQLIREAFIDTLDVDVVILSTLFEGAGDNSVISIGEFSRTFTVPILYDLIPLIHKEQYLADPRVMEWYQDKLSFLKKANAWFAISESSRKEGIQYLGLPENRVKNIGAAIDGTFRKLDLKDDEKPRFLKEFGIMKPFLLYSGATDPRKNVERLIEAYAKLPVFIRETHQLVLAGGMPEDHLQAFKRRSCANGFNDGEVIFTGRLSDEQLVALYNLCKAFILPSFHEGFGLPALEAMTCGAPTIGSNCSSVPEVISLDEALFDPYSVDSIAKKIEQVLADDKFRHRLVNHAEKRSKNFSWELVAERAIEALEYYQSCGELTKNGVLDPAHSVKHLIDIFSKFNVSSVSDDDLRSCAAALAKILPRQDACVRIYVDVSELRRRDLGSGIQRVVRNISKELLISKDLSCKVELVYATEMDSYRVDRSLTTRLLNEPVSDKDEGFLDPRPGDIFLGLDFHDQIIRANEEYFNYLRNIGVKIFFVVYDMLPLLLKKFFSEEVSQSFACWLDIVTNYNGCICISKSVADDLRKWLLFTHPQRLDRQLINWFHLGADLKNSIPTNGLSDNADRVLEKISTEISFLMVGTLEPRKGYSQVLSAFEELWSQGFQCRLIFVGRQGWMVESLVSKIRFHCEQGESLLWLHDASDEYLERVYRASTCLIAASEGEGFGLPVIEAGQRELPIIARDIPVFREVAGECAFYFSGTDPKALAIAIQSWLDLYAKGEHPTPKGMKWLNWKESTQQLKGILCQQM